MITFLEGLPRSGKSYSAMKDFVVPALKEGRKVFSNVAGLNHAQLADLAGIELSVCRGLLIQLDDSQMVTVYRHVESDSLVLLDEAQDFWPTGRQKLSPEMTTFITRHGHLGLDIVLMGQSVKDVHALWRRRIERKNYFLKLSALGKPNRYSVTFFNAVLRGEDVEFEQIQTMQYDYDAAYFGAYKSHADETKNKSTLTESRAVVWNTPLFKKWIPIFAVVLVFALGYLVWFAKYGISDMGKKSQVTAKQITDGPQPSLDQLRGAGGFQPVVNGVPVAPPPVAVPVSVPVAPVMPLDVMEQLNKMGRIRFTGFIRVGDKIKGFVEWRDPALNVIQHMTLTDVAGLGYAVMINQAGTYATFTKGATTLTALAWPLDKPVGRVTEAEQAKVAGHPRGVVVASASGPPN